MGIFRPTILITLFALLAGCASDRFRGKTVIPVSTQEGERSVIGMYVEPENWQCATANCPQEKRLYNEDFSDYVVVNGPFEQRDIGRVLEVVGTMNANVLEARTYRRRSLIDYKAILNEGADQYMENNYGCVLAWNRSYQWHYDRNDNSATLDLYLDYPLSEAADRPKVILSFDGYSGIFRDEERFNVNGKLCQG